MADNQHYITKAYLDKFIHPRSTQNVLYRYTRGTGSCKASGTRNLGSADSFYLQEEDGSQTNRLDEARKKSEALYFSSGKRTPSPLSKCIFEPGYIPPCEDKIMLAGPAAFLWCGSPVQVHNAAMMALVCHQQDLFNRMNTEQALEIYRETHGEKAEQKLEEDRESLLKGELVVDVGEDRWKQLGFCSFESEELWLNALMEMGLDICDCHYKSFFLTSDNPVVLTCASQPRSPGLGLPDAEVWFPISHNRGLLWSRKHYGIQRTGFGYSETRAMNRRVIRWCYKDTYSPLPEAWIASAVKENSFDPLYGHYGSLERIIDNHSQIVSGKNGEKREIVDLLAGLRSGDRADILGI